jgi:hypothetical protein
VAELEFVVNATTISDVKVFDPLLDKTLVFGDESCSIAWSSFGSVVAFLSSPDS